ncbi:TPA: hypothetical protein VD528_001487 [Streptococcus pyogenes]|nr:hypothetical protein [Streptococcus pyogenes]
MRKYIEFKDEWKSATDHLNDFIDKNKYAKVTVVLWQGSDQVIAEQCFLKVLEEMQK